MAFGRFLVIFGLGIVISLFIENRDYANSAIGVGFFLGLLVSIRTKLVMNEEFKCKECSQIIERKLQNSGVDHEPILYHCDTCEILWHTDNVSH